MSPILHETGLYWKYYLLFLQCSNFIEHPIFLFAKSGDSRLEYKADETVLQRSLKVMLESFGFSLVGWSWKVFKLRCDIIRFLILCWLHGGWSRKGETGSKDIDLNRGKGSFEPGLQSSDSQATDSRDILEMEATGLVEKGWVFMLAILFCYRHGIFFLESLWPSEHTLPIVLGLKTVWRLEFCAIFHMAQLLVSLKHMLRLNSEPVTLSQFITTWLSG